MTNHDGMSAYLSVPLSGRHATRALIVWSFVLTCVCPADEKASTPAAGSTTPRPSVALPGLTINFKERFVDIDATVCLDSGTLELVACTKETKEHESIVAISAQPRHVHAALLLVGAQPGNPALRRRVGEEGGERWVHLPPRGDPISVSLVIKDDQGRKIEQPISRFIEPTSADEGAPASDKDAKRGGDFPNTFLFTGSLIRTVAGKEDGPRQYMSDASGNVISIATFGDETLGLPEVHSHQNGALLWQVNTDNLPKVGAKVTLRLRPQPRAKTKAKNQ